jgi:hypothetical protein
VKVLQDPLVRRTLLAAGFVLMLAAILFGGFSLPVALVLLGVATVSLGIVAATSR